MKAAHVAAMVAFVGGLLVNAVAGAGPDAARADVRRWNRRVTTPALLLTWAFGLTLARLGAWFPAPWLLVKLGLVLVLSGLHGVQSGRLRRAGPRPDRWGGGLVLAVLALIAGLAVVKPF